MHPWAVTSLGKRGRKLRELCPYAYYGAWKREIGGHFKKLKKWIKQSNNYLYIIFWCGSDCTGKLLFVHIRLHWLVDLWVAGGSCFLCIPHLGVAFWHLVYTMYTLVRPFVRHCPYDEYNGYLPIKKKKKKGWKQESWITYGMCRRTLVKR